MELKQLKKMILLVIVLRIEILILKKEVSRIKFWKQKVNFYIIFLGELINKDNIVDTYLNNDKSNFRRVRSELVN